MCPERIAGQLGDAEQRLLPGVVRGHPHAGRPRDLPLHGREQPPPTVLISRQERLGAFDRRQRGRPGTGERPARRSRQRRLRLPRQAVPVVYRPYLLTPSLLVNFIALSPKYFSFAKLAGNGVIACTNASALG